MTFLDHTLNWVKGEMFEGGMLFLWGAMLAVMAAYFWKFGHSSTSKVLVVPFLVAALFWGIAGGASYYRNTVRLSTYSVEYETNPAVFVESEDKRVDAFIWVYPYLLTGWTVLTLAGLAVFMLWGGDHGRAIGLGLIIFAVPGLLVDHTSEHNAYTYRAEIDKQLLPVKADK